MRLEKLSVIFLGDLKTRAEIVRFASTQGWLEDV